MEGYKKRRRPMAEINVVPYIDVMLVLLVIFMITAPLLNLGVEVELPKADAEPLDTEQSNEPLVVTVGGLLQVLWVDPPIVAVTGGTHHGCGTQ